MEINLLLRLLIAHLLTDFILQPKDWVDDKALKKIKSVKFLMHVTLTAIMAYVFSGYYMNWFIPMTIFITHYCIDLLKTHLQDSFRNFIIDQFLHVLVIIIIWLTIDNRWSDWLILLSDQLVKTDFWLIMVAYLFVTWPLGIMIGKGTQKWRNQIAKEQEKVQFNKLYKASMEGKIEGAEQQVDLQEEEQGLGLASAGKWIGICERVLILTFMLLHQYTAIGFLMTAKSILRFSEKETNTQLKTEYVLVGTLVSFTSSAIMGVVISYLLN
ncbi:hypothetical protein AAKU52_002441 [Pedobacter sp. CG_S7]|uniref:DUF3307 domain-containing protein n=1 Tax=Pedobacter sp. CG_S7 TaxID=3143930 RepID=UPI003394904D